LYEELVTKTILIFWIQLEDLVQETLAPTLKPSGAHNVVYAATRATSLTSQIAGPSKSMSTTATSKTPGST
jgi:hypothetical protein